VSRVLVIGGTRFVGYYLTWRLLAAGHRVTLFNRGTIPDPFGDRVERLHGDRTTPAFADLLGRRSFDAAVDFAAYTADDARSVLATLAGKVGHYVFLSTGQVYLVREGCPSPAREEDFPGDLVPEPADPAEREGWLYGVNKRAAEEVFSPVWAERRFPVTTFRIPIVHGERDYYRRIESYLWRLMDGGPVLLPDGGPQICRHVYGDQVARAICALLRDRRTFGRAFNLCQEEQPTLRDLVGLLARHLGAPDRIVDVPRSALEAAGLPVREVSPLSGRWMSHLDPSRARRELGFRHEPLQSYLGKIVASFLTHPPSEPPPSYSYRDAELAFERGR
jgi:nucleoside-diphosphate-sugar epimerase